MKPRVGGQRHDVGGRTGHIKGNISELLKSTSSDHINNRLQRNYSGFRALTHVWRRRADLLKFEAAPLCDCDMRIWEVIPRHSYMNLTPAFVSSTIERPHLPESHLKVTKSHFSCQSLFMEPGLQDWTQRHCLHQTFHTIWCSFWQIPFGLHDSGGGKRGREGEFQCSAGLIIKKNSCKNLIWIWKHEVLTCS